MKITDLNLTFLKYFYDAISRDSLTLAAEENNVSRPAISQAIKRLEQSFGKQLLEHKKNDLQITPEGEALFNECKKFFPQVDKFLINLKSNHKVAQVRIGISHSLFDDFIIRTGRAFQKNNISTTVKFGTSFEIKKMIDSGDADLGIFIDDGLPFFGFLKTIFKGKFCVANISTSAKINHIICTEPRAETIFLLSKYKSYYNHDLEILHKIESWTAAKAMCLLGLGPCLVPDFLVHGSLKAVKLPFNLPDYTVSLASKKQADLRPSIRSTMDLIIENY